MKSVSKTFLLKDGEVFFPNGLFQVTCYTTATNLANQDFWQSYYTCQNKAKQLSISLNSKHKRCWVYYFFSFFIVQNQHRSQVGRKSHKHFALLTSLFSKRILKEERGKISKTRHTPRQPNRQFVRRLEKAYVYDAHGEAKRLDRKKLAHVSIILHTIFKALQWNMAISWLQGKLRRHN